MPNTENPIQPPAELLSSGARATTPLANASAIRITIEIPTSSVMRGRRVSAVTAAHYARAPLRLRRFLGPLVRAHLDR